MDFGRNFDRPLFQGTRVRKSIPPLSASTRRVGLESISRRAPLRPPSQFRRRFIFRVNIHLRRFIVYLRSLQYPYIRRQTLRSRFQKPLSVFSVHLPLLSGKEIWKKRLSRQFEMERKGLTVKDLEPMIGKSNRVYEILNRKCSLTLKMIWKLHESLGIPAESLIKPPQPMHNKI